MASEGKVRKGFYIEEDLLEQVDGLLKQADVKSIKKMHYSIICTTINWKGGRWYGI